MGTTTSKNASTSPGLPETLHCNEEDSSKHLIGAPCSRSAGTFKKCIRAINLRHDKNQVRLQRFTSGKHHFRTRESHYSDPKTFCNSFHAGRWSIRAFAKNVSCVCSVIVVSKCKRLSCERIDDRIKKNLNRQIRLYGFIFLNIQLTNLSKKHALCRSRQSVRRLLRATRSVRSTLVLLLVGTRKYLFKEQIGFARRRLRKRFFLQLKWLAGEYQSNAIVDWFRTVVALV